MKENNSFKFRAWWIEQEVMCDVDVIGFSEGAITVSNENTTYKHLGLNEVELMQYTGLKDKNGVEIFEGDILYYEPYETHSNDRVVEYIDGAYHGRLIRNGYSKLLAECVYETEIIGNIWESPELLEVAK